MSEEMPPPLPSRIVSVIRCPLCDRQRECEYLGPSDFGGRWQCLGCGCEFEIPRVLTTSLVSKEASNG